MGVKIRWIRDKWYVVIDYQGKRISRMVGTDRKAAERVKSQIEARILLEGAGVVEKILGEGMAPMPTLAEYGSRWIEERATTDLKESTRIRYTQSFRDHISTCAIAEKLLDEINYSNIKSFIVELRDRRCISRKNTKLSRNSIRNTLTVLRLILSEAEAEGYIKGNPAANKKLGQFYRDASRKEEIHPFTVEEVHQVEEIFREKYPWHYALVVCLFRTGIRAGEARGLQWGDVNLRTPEDDDQALLVIWPIRVAAEDALFQEDH